MSFLDKLMFWKKADNLGDMGLGKDALSGDLASSDFAMGGSMPDMNNQGFDSNSDNLGLDLPSSSQPQSNQFNPQNPYQNMQQNSQNQFNRPSSDDYASQNNMFQKNPLQNPSGPSIQQNQQMNYTLEKDIEIISSKLDALRSAIESINQRLANIESMARNAQEDGHTRRYRY